jgi:ParB family chromosome partitioning protein
MRLPWQKAETQQQLDLLGGEPSREVVAAALRPKAKAAAPLTTTGIARIVPTSQIEDDPANPRTEFPDGEVDDLADDIRRRGILQALVVHPADDRGRYRLHFGAMRLRAAVRAGLHEVPVIIRDAPADPYAQVAENLKRHGLSPLDLARFIRGRVDAGESNAAVASKLGMDLTSVAHHLALLELPPVLDDAMKSGRCTSPRALYELRKLHAAQPEMVAAAVAGPEPLTRSAINALKTDTPSAPCGTAHGRTADALDQIDKLCGRIEGVMQKVIASGDAIDGTRLAAVGARLAQIAVSCGRGSDGPTPCNGGVDGQR